ncbi:MAG: hypothetical protein DMG22_11965, partial [Acidobacteria bacterium]
HKGGLTPWQIIQQLAPRLPLALCLLPPTLLDYRLDAQRRDPAPTPQGGYDLPRLPYLSLGAHGIDERPDKKPRAALDPAPGLYSLEIQVLDAGGAEANRSARFVIQ